MPFTASWSCRELLPPAQRVRFAWRRANPFGALALLRTHAVLLWLSGVNFLGNLAHAVLPSVSVLYLMYRYGWDERLVGLALAVVGIGSIVVQGAVVGPVTKAIGERAALLLGLAFGVAGFLVFAVARTGLEFCIGIPLLALWGLEGPASMALMSRLVGASEQGQLQGANASVTGIANLFGPGLVHGSFRSRYWRRPRDVSRGRAVFCCHAPDRCGRRARMVRHAGAGLAAIVCRRRPFPGAAARRPIPVVLSRVL